MLSPLVPSSAEGKRVISLPVRNLMKEQAYADISRSAEIADIVRRILGRRGSRRVLPRWAYFVGSAPLAIASGVCPRMPNGLSVPSFKYGFDPYHVSGARADDIFGLTHRPTEQTVLDSLRWFRHTGLAPWLPERLHPVIA